MRPGARAGESGTTRLCEPDDLGDLYLNRCRVDTPGHLVERVWSHVRERRTAPPELAVDFGAGDGRFAVGGFYKRYLGFEIDANRVQGRGLPGNAHICKVCAFSDRIENADVSIGNPPYVRNQLLPKSWDQTVAKQLVKRTGVEISGLANAWQYFFLLSLASTKPDGLVALVIPYEWVSRPSVRHLREYIRRNGWGVHVYRLLDETFHGVMTTASITVIDKREVAAAWTYYEEHADGGFRQLRSPANSELGVLEYVQKAALPRCSASSRRGLSPGSQKALVLTEATRAAFGLAPGRDVVRCVTSLRPIEDDCARISEAVFHENYRDAGLRCWLVNTAEERTPALRAYLNSVPVNSHDTATCNDREEWWKFTMPDVPPILVATGFTGDRPKISANLCGARAVGSVSGIYGVSQGSMVAFLHHYRTLRLRDRIVPHSNGLRKVEINQMNALILEIENHIKAGLNGR